MSLLLLRTDRSAVKRSAVNIGQQEHYNMVNPVGQMMHAISVLDMVKLGAKIGVKLVCGSMWSAHFIAIGRLKRCSDAALSGLTWYTTNDTSDKMWLKADELWLMTPKPIFP